MRKNREMTDDKRLALLSEYLSSGKSKTAFEKEKGLQDRTPLRITWHIQMGLLQT